MEIIKHNSINGVGQHSPKTSLTIVLAGATGDLGNRIAIYLLQAGAQVKALVRKGTHADKIDLLQKKGAHICEVDFENVTALTDACKGAACVVSALNGLEDVIIGVQSNLLQAAVDAGVSRFIPSDYCIDYRNLPTGSNRNLDLRRRFNEKLNQSSIAATSILNGMFTNLLTGEAPFILFGLKRVLYWGSQDQEMDFTTIENTAAFTARAALDEHTPRYLQIAGDVVNAKGLAVVATESTGQKFKLLRAGSLGGLKTMINITKTLLPKKEEVFPPWQGMQYMYNMFTGFPKLTHLDNNRYAGIHWTTVQEVLAKRESQLKKD
jgi:hypothetical protein